MPKGREKIMTAANAELNVELKWLSVHREQMTERT